MGASLLLVSAQKGFFAKMESASRYHPLLTSADVKKNTQHLMENAALVHALIGREICVAQTVVAVFMIYTFLVSDVSV